MRIFVLMLSCVLLFSGVGCGGVQNERAGGYTVTDAEGRTVAFDQKPARVLNYGLWLDDIVLGMLPPERLVGIDHLADDPNSSNIVSIAETIPVKLNQPSAEQVVALHPDVVFLDTGKDAAVAESLRDLGIRVVACRKPRTPEEVRAAVQLVAAALGEEAKGTALIAAYDTACAELTERVAEIPTDQRKKVLVISMSPTFGNRGGLFDALCTMAGVTNGAAVADEGAYPRGESRCPDCTGLERPRQLRHRQVQPGVSGRSCAPNGEGDPYAADCASA